MNFLKRSIIELIHNSVWTQSDGKQVYYIRGLQIGSMNQMDWF